MSTLKDLILLAYAKEGIKSADVAMIVYREHNHRVFHCMAPQQHNAERTQSIRRRLAHDLGVDTATILSQVCAGNDDQNMHVIRLAVPIHG